MKRVTSILVMITLLAALAIPFGAFAETAEPVKLTFWTLAARQAFEDEIIAAFMAENPDITIEPSYYSPDDIKTGLKVAASSNSMPSMWYNWGGSLATYYPENNLSYDLTQYAKDHDWSSKYLASSLELCTLGGQLCGMPQSLSGMALWFRKDIFEKCGIAIPNTFAELETACATLKEQGYIPFATGGQFGWHVMRYLQDLIEYYAGAETHDALSSFSASWTESDAVTKAFAKFKEWVDLGYFQDGFITEDPNFARLYVFGGTCAMISDSPTMAAEIIKYEANAADYGFFGFPTETNEDGTGRMAAYVKMTQFNANLTDAELDAAIKFWDFYYSDECLKTYGIEQPTAIIGKVLPENLAVADGFLDMIDALGIYTQTDQALPTVVADQLFALQDSVALGDTAPEAAGAAMQSVIDTYKAQ